MSHRALVLAALADGVSEIEGLLPSRDVQATARCLRSLGARLEPGGRVRGWGERGWREPDGVLRCGNSGTTMRLLAGVLAAGKGLAVLDGDASLRRRPMARITGPLRRMGARVAGRQGGRFAPLVLQGGSLSGLSYRLPVASAQVKSCLLLAGLRAAAPVELEEPFRSRDHTERMLQALGVGIHTREGWVLLDPPGRPLPPFRFAVPGDPSSAAFPVAATVLHPGARVRLEGVGLNPTRTGFYELLRRMGARLELLPERTEMGEPVGSIRAEGSDLVGIEVGPEEVPGAIDELPLLAVVACAARGVTRVRGARELRHKESDRIGAVVEELSRMGADIRETEDGFSVRGPCRLEGTTVRCHRDHRLEMGLAVAALAARGPSCLEGAGWCDVSFPGFWEMLERLAQGVP